MGSNSSRSVKNVKNSVEILYKEAEERNLIYSIMWLNIDENKRKLVFEFYKIAGVHFICKNWRRVNKLVHIIASLVKKMVKKY